MEANTPAAPTKSIEPGKVVSETISIYREHWAPLLGCAAVVFVLIGLVSGLLESGGGLFLVLLAGIVRLAGYALYAGFVVKLVVDVRDGRRDNTVGELLSSATPVIVPLIIYGILFGIGVTIGLVLLIVPGLILLTIWSLGAPAIVVENTGAIDAFGRSYRLVKGEGWSVFGALALVFLIVVGIGIVLGIIAAPIGGGATVVAAIISNIVTAPIFAIAVSVMFFDLGGGHPGDASPTLTEPEPAPPTTEPPPATEPPHPATPGT